MDYLLLLKIFTVLVVVTISLYIIIPWLIGRFIRNQFIRNINDNGLLFTFDDGPDPNTTPEILKILKKYSVKGTFFVIGEYIKSRPSLLDQIQMEGHQVGYHSYQHKYPWLVGPFQTYHDMKIEEITFNEIGVQNATGIYRPPYGKLNLISLIYCLVKRRKIIFWSIDPRDYECSDPNTIYSRVMTSLSNRANNVILFHDGRIKYTPDIINITPEALDMILNSISQKTVNGKINYD